MHVVIAGSGEVAFNIADALMVDHEVVIIGPADRDLGRLHKLDADVMPGMCTSTADLERAGVARAHAFVAATDADERNLVACVAARKLGAKQTLCVLSQPGFLAVQESDGELARSLGVDVVVRPSEQLAREIVRIVTVPGALDVEHFASGRIRLLSHKVEDGAPICHKPLRKTMLPAEAVLVMGRRGEEVFLPSGHTHLKPGDKITAMGTPKGVRELLYDHLRRPGHHEDHKATVVGGGDVGLLVTRGLEKAGWEVKVIESNRDRCEQIAPMLRSLVLHGDGSDIDLLEEEQASEAPVLIAVTNNDEKNLLVSLMARTLGVDRVITRAQRLSNEIMFERVGIDVVRSAHGAVVRSVVSRIASAGFDIRAELEHGDMHVIEIELPATYAPICLSELKNTHLFSIVGAIIRGREVRIPRGSTELMPLDHLFVFCRIEDEDRSRRLYLDPPRRKSED